MALLIGDIYGSSLLSDEFTAGKANLDQISVNVDSVQDEQIEDCRKTVFVTMEVNATRQKKAERNSFGCARQLCRTDSASI